MSGQILTPAANRYLNMGSPNYYQQYLDRTNFDQCSICEDCFDDPCDHHLSLAEIDARIAEWREILERRPTAELPVKELRYWAQIRKEVLA